MSRTIDERVVSMQFDNKQFENNVKTSMSTLEKLKQSLNFKGLSKGLEGLNSSVKKVDMSPLGNATQTVGLKFSAMYTMADQALRNITTRVQQTAESMIKAFTIDPIKSGLAEYETQIGAVQTILANTQSKGSTLLDVNAALDELNTYADKTIYNFTEMTRNIGTFTAAGVDLDKSVSSIKGIANLAAVSGSTSQQASTAMYQLSQALAAGKVQLMDWNSVVNAGMGGQLFQDALKRTAKQLGHNVDEMIEKYGSFRESLTQGEWLTAEVLTETLTQLSGAYSEADLIAQGYSEKQAKEIVELSTTAVDAATKVKTFTQLMDTLKEAAQSGWTQTWELIVGDFEEAKELWTSISDIFGGFIGASAEARNTLLSGALDTNWEKLIAQINEAGIETSTFEERIKGVLKEHGYDVEELVEKHGSLEKVFRDGAVSSDLLKESLNGIGETVKKLDLSDIEGELKLGMSGDDVKKMQEALELLKFDVGEKGLDGKFGPDTQVALKAFQELNGIEPSGILDSKTLALLDDQLTETASVAGDLGESITSLIDDIEKLGGRELLIESLKNAFEGLKNFINPVVEAFREIFPAMKPEQLYNLIEGFHNLTAKFRLFAKTSQGREIFANLKSTFKGLFAAVDIVAKVVGGALSAGFKAFSKILGFIAPKILAITGRAGDAVVKFREWLFESGRLTEIFNAFGNGIKAGIAKIKEWIDAFVNLPIVQENIERFQKAFSDTFSGGFEKIREFIDRVKSMDSISFENIVTIFKDFKENVLGYFLNMDDPFGKIKEAARQFKDSVVKYFESASEKFTGLKQTVIDFVTAIKEKIGDNLGSILAIGVLLGFLFLVKKIKDAMETLAKPLDMVGDLFKSIGGAFDAFKKNTKAKTIQSIATSIAILAGSVALLALLPKDQVWSAVGAIAALTAILIGISFAIGKIPNTGDFGKMAISLAGLAGAVLLLAIAAKTMGMVDWSALGKCGVVLGVLVGALILMSKFNTSGGTFLGFGQTIMQLSTSLLILSGAMLILGRMDIGTLTQGGIAIGVFFGMMVGMMAATKLLAKDLPRFGTTMAALSISLLLMSVATSVLGNMKLDTLIKGGIAVAAFLGMMVGIMAATKLLAKDLPRFGSTMFGLSTALLLMAVAVKVLAGMDAETFVKGGAAVLGFIGIMAIMMAATKLLSKNLNDAAKIGVMMIAFSTAILILVGAVALLGMIEEDNLNKAVGALAKISLIFAALMVASKFASDMKGIISLSISIGILAVALAALSFIDPVKLVSATTALSVVIGMFAVLVASTHFMKTSMGPLLMLSGMVLILSGVLILLSKMEVGDTLQTAASLSILVLSLSAACAILSLVNIGGALGAVAGLAIFVGGLAAILAIVGGLAQIPGVGWLISEGGDFLQKIGTALGQFIGGIVGGTMTGISAGLPQIATDLSTFMTNLQPFLDNIVNIDKESTTAVKNLASMLLMLTGASLLDAIASWITGGSSLETFAEEIQPFGRAMVIFSKTVSGKIDEGAVTAAANAGKALTEMANTIPNCGGLISFFAGDNKLSEFTPQIVPFGRAMAIFSKTVSGKIDEGAVTAAANAGKALTELANTIPNCGGVVAFFAGDNKMDAFALQLVPFARAMVIFSKTVSGKIDEGAITAAANAGKAMSEMANTVPNTGGLVTFFTGDNNLEEFGKQLKSFGTAIKDFSNEVADISGDKVTAAANAGKALSEMANTIPNTGGLIAFFTGDNDMDEFGRQLVPFGEAIKSFSDKVAGINAGNVTAATDAATNLVTLGKKLGTSSNVWNLGDFGYEIKDFADYFETANTSFTAVDTSVLHAVITQMFRLATLAAKDFTGLETLSTAIKTLAETGIDELVTAFENSYNKVQKAGIGMVQALLEAIRSRDNVTKFSNAGKYLVEGFAHGISANTYKAKAKAGAMARAAAQAAEKALAIKSPSKVGYGIGEFFGMGFVNALDDYATKTYAAGAEIADSAKSGLSHAVAKVSRLLENGIDDQPTIRPVLDLSDVSAGASAINGMFGMNPSVGVLSNINSVNSMMNRNQNGGNDDVVTAIEDLGRKLNNRSGDTYNFGGISYNNGDEISDAVATLVRAIKVEGRT